MKRIVLLLMLLSVPVGLAETTYHPVLGKIDIRALPVPVWGVLLGLVDGIFNPCALSVLFFIAAYLLSIGSRRKLLTIGVAYLLVVFVVYSLFVYLLTRVIYVTAYYIPYVQSMKYILGGIVLFLAALQLKDFFFYGKGISLEIPKFAKPHIETLTKAATLPAALLLGVLVSLVEMPCGIQFPIVYAGIVENVPDVPVVLYSLWYTFFFVLPLIVLMLAFYFGFTKVEEAEKKRLNLRKYMRLVSGIVLVFFGIAFILGWL